MIVNVDSFDMLGEFYRDSSFTLEGVTPDEESLTLLKNFLEDNDCKLINEVFYVYNGKLMNEKYGLIGDNAYPDDLSFITIKNSDLSNVSAIIAARFFIGARWFDDIVDNNAERNC